MYTTCSGRLSATPASRREASSAEAWRYTYTYTTPYTDTRYTYTTPWAYATNVRVYYDRRLQRPSISHATVDQGPLLSDAGVEQRELRALPREEGAHLRRGWVWYSK